MRKKVKWCLLQMLIAASTFIQAMAQEPLLGAEVYIEPGQTTAQIDHWFKLLHENEMPIARVFLMWNYLERKPDEWNFELWDAAFNAAKKYNVRITATLVPNSPPFYRGSPYFYKAHIGEMFENENSRDLSKKYIQTVVKRYRDHPALDSWWLYNEPGQYPSPDHLAMDSYRQWLRVKYKNIDSLNNTWLSFFSSFDKIEYDQSWKDASWVWPVPFLDWNRFWRIHLNSQIQWLAEEVRKYDQNHPTTTNVKNLLDMPAHYDFPGLKKPLNFLGASVHPSWDFSKLNRKQWSLGVSWVNDFIRGAADSTAYWISELQGGNTIYSSLNPICPTENDITQWIWCSIGSGAKRILFWSLNARMQGGEAAEWSMLDFQDQPSGRMLKSKSIAETINRNNDLFRQAKPVSSQVVLLLSQESLLIQERKQNRYSNLEGVKDGLHFKSSFACYQMLMEQGVQVEIKEINNFRWEAAEEKKVYILASAMALSEKDINLLKKLTADGNKLVILGLTGLFDYNEKAWVINRESPLSELAGGTLKNIQLIGEKFFVNVGGIKDLPAHAWEGEILPGKGKPIGHHKDKIIALENIYGKGKVLWVPCEIDIGAWLHGGQPLGELLDSEIREFKSQSPFKFAEKAQGCFMKILVCADGYITVLINSSETNQEISIVAPKFYMGRSLYGAKAFLSKQSFTLSAGETVVTYWSRKE